VTVPSAKFGDVTADLATRRGHADRVTHDPTDRGNGLGIFPAR